MPPCLCSSVFICGQFFSVPFCVIRGPTTFITFLPLSPIPTFSKISFMQATTLFRQLFSVLLLFFIGNDIIAQRRPDSKYGIGGSRGSTPIGVRPRMDTTFDPNGTFREIKIYDFDIPDYHLNGEKTEYYNCEGVPVFQTVIVRGFPDEHDPTKSDDYYSEAIEKRDGVITSGERKRINEDGTRVFERYDPTPGDDGQPKGWRRIPVPDRTFPGIQPPRATTPKDCDKDKRTGCAPTGEVFLGYSYLNTAQEGENESIPVGIHAAAVIPISQKLGAVADASLHRKKVDDLTLMRTFLMGGLQYYIYKKQEEQKLRLLIRLLAGLAMERQKYSYGGNNDINKATAFAFAFGLGFEYELNRRLVLGVLTDYIRTRFNDDSQGNIRASAGIKINLGCK
jgi:hypothetical protein